MAITIDVKKGDTILVGKFKNKKMVIKDIGVDKHGMPTINGRKSEKHLKTRKIIKNTKTPSKPIKNMKTTKKL